MNQVAKLFIRGSLVNKTAKQLTNDQKKEVSRLIDIVWNDNKLDTTKYKFCSILKSTIGNEYLNKDYAMNEILITIWRTAVDVLYHNPKPSLLNDRDARIKYFKQCIYMYMRQILNENKIPHNYSKHIINDDALSAAEIVIRSYFDLSDVKYDIDYEDNTIIFNIHSEYSNIVKNVLNFKTEIRDYGILITIMDDSIIIQKVSESKTFSKKLLIKTRMIFCSMEWDDGDSDNNFKQYCEQNGGLKLQEEMMDSIVTKDVIETLSARLPSDIKEVFDILVNTPKDFIDIYYPNRQKTIRPKMVHIADYLGISKKEVQNAIKIIQSQAEALDL